MASNLITQKCSICGKSFKRSKFHPQKIKCENCKNIKEDSFKYCTGTKCPYKDECLRVTKKKSEVGLFDSPPFVVDEKKEWSYCPYFQSRKMRLGMKKFRDKKKTNNDGVDV